MLFVVNKKTKKYCFSPAKDYGFASKTNIKKMDKIPVSPADIESLFDSDGFFHLCSKEEIVTEGATYYTCRSDNGKFCLLVEEVVRKKPNVLGSFPWREEYVYINPFLVKREYGQSHDNVCYVETNDNEPISKIPKTGFIRRGIHQWGIPVFA